MTRLRAAGRGSARWRGTCPTCGPVGGLYALHSRAGRSVSALLPHPGCPSPDGLPPGEAGVVGSFAGPLELLWGEHQCLAAVRRPARVSRPQGRAALVASVRRLTRKPSFCVSFQATKFGSQASQKVTKEASAFVLSRFLGWSLASCPALRGRALPRATRALTGPCMHLPPRLTCPCAPLGACGLAGGGGLDPAPSLVAGQP